MDTKMTNEELHQAYLLYVRLHKKVDKEKARLAVKKYREQNIEKFKVIEKKANNKKYEKYKEAEKARSKANYQILKAKKALLKNKVEELTTPPEIEITKGQTIEN